MNKKILIIDDDSDLNHLLSEYLLEFGFHVTSATRPKEGLEVMRAQAPHLIILDVMLPGQNGFDLCKEIRQETMTPIIMLTARGDLNDRIVGLELGADDYLPKPYEPRELVARIQSVLRRTEGPVKWSATGTTLKSHHLTLDITRASACLANENIELTTAEFKILHLLMKNAGETLSRENIFLHACGTDWDSFDRTVDVLVSRLRQKLKDDPRSPQFLKTIWGTGYRFVGQVQHDSV